MFRTVFHVNAVIFDMDGVITNTMPDHYRCWKEIFREEGIRVTYEDVYKREGQPGLTSVKEIFAEHGRPFRRKEAEGVLKKKEALFNKIVKTRFITGARTFLKHLHGKGIVLALVTGTSKHELYQILPASVRDLFSVIVTGNDVKNGKPHPEPYLKSLRKLDIGASRAVAIENAPFGIRSAKRAGLTCLALETSLPRPYLTEADKIFTSIRELEEKTSFSCYSGN